MTDPRPLRADAERNRTRLLEAAREVFAEEGLTAGVEAVARRAGVGVGTLYRRFPAKEDLLQAILQERASALLAAIRQAGEHEDPWEAFAGAARAIVDTITSDRALLDGVYESFGGLPESIDEIRSELREALGAISARAQEAGLLRGDRDVVELFSLFGTLGRIPAWRLAERPELPARHLDVVLEGLRAR